MTIRCAFCLTLNGVDIEKASQRPTCGSCQRPMLLDRPVKVTDEDFETTVLGAEAPVLVDFYADWCAPCKILAPTLDGQQLEYAADDVRYLPPIEAHFADKLEAMVRDATGAP